MEISKVKTSRSEPLFLESDGNRLFALLLSPLGPARGVVLYLPPFAEEMNRCRSHVVSQARALAAIGYTCLLLDPYGTGESEGEFQDASWDRWLQDATAAALWLQRRGAGPITLWGVRTGALLVAELAGNLQLGISRVVFWQPVMDGNAFLTQLLRLRVASQLVGETERENTTTIRKRLSAGEVIEVAGYPMSGRLADGMAARNMDTFAADLARCRITWIEVVAREAQDLGAGSLRMVERLSAAGARIEKATVSCPMIWQVHERVEAPELQQVTLRLLGVHG